MKKNTAKVAILIIVCIVTAVSVGYFWVKAEMQRALRNIADGLAVPFEDWQQTDHPYALHTGTEVDEVLLIEVAATLKDSKKAGPEGDDYGNLPIRRPEYIIIAPGDTIHCEIEVSGLMEAGGPINPPDGILDIMAKKEFRLSNYAEVMAGDNGMLGQYSFDLTLDGLPENYNADYIGLPLIIQIQTTEGLTGTAVYNIVTYSTHALTTAIVRYLIIVACTAISVITARLFLRRNSRQVLQ